MRRALLSVFVGTLVACARGEVTTEPWSEADALFHVEPRWIGGDGAITVPLGGDRVLWLFGDSFIALSPQRVRARAHMVRNSVAIQTGTDPSNAFMKFYWSGDGDAPASFMPEEGDRWFWPGQGVRLGDRALLFYGRIMQVGEGSWGFGSDGWKAVMVGPVDEEPDNWTIEPVKMPSGRQDIVLGMSVLDEPDGHVYAYGERGRQHSIYLARWPRDAAASADLSQPEWWCGRPKGWCQDGEPRAVIDVGAPELSVHREDRLGGYVEVHTEGFGAAKLAIRTAPRPEGPWSGPRIVYDPPEAHEDDAHIYAGKAHVALTGADIVATYVPSKLSDIAPIDEGRLYYPRFVRLSLEEQ